MSKHKIFWLAWLLWVLFLIITFFSELLTFKNTPSMSPNDILGNIFFQLVILVFITVGAFIASHRPQNPIGWIICAVAIIWVLSDFALAYAVYSLITAPVPGRTTAIVSLATSCLAHYRSPDCLSVYFAV